MTAEPQRIGVLTAGGDAPGLNAVIRAVVKTAVLGYGFHVVGIEDGFEGLLAGSSGRPLGPAEVMGLLPRGGSILRCTNRGHFGLGPGGHSAEPALREAAAAVDRLGLAGLVVIGGDGSQAIAARLQALGVKVVGVPKTIDNDLPGTDVTFGFDSALSLATDAIDRLHTTAESHGRVMVVEVMGRHAGWIALEAGLAGGADVVLIPEIPFDLSRAARHVTERDRNGRRFSIVVAAEGAAPVGGTPTWQRPPEAGRSGQLGGIAGRVASELEALTGKQCRTVVLGHLQRGGSPSASDRLLGTALGAGAVHALAAGKHGAMVAWRAGRIETVPLDEVVGRVKTIALDHPLIRTARDVGICLG